MSLRFRRSIKLAPGVRLNLSGSGASLSVGPRGASLSFGTRGAYLNSGIPGTGLYSRTRLTASSDTEPAAKQLPAAQRVNVPARISVEDDGSVRFLDSDGNPLSEYLTTLAKRQHGTTIRDFLSDAAHKLNATVEDLGRIHVATPPPDDKPVRTIRAFPTAPPVEPIPKEISAWVRLTGQRDQIQTANDRDQKSYQAALDQWRRVKELFELREREASRLFDHRLLTDVDFMHQVFEDNLHDIVWPRETQTSFEIADNASEISIEVDLPEIEDLPKRMWKLPDRGYQLRSNNLTQKALRELYVRHVHSIGFRVIGEAFATLPTIMRATLSAFTQRNDVSTGNAVNAYVHSVRVERTAWATTNFRNLDAIEVVKCFERFELRRKIARNGVLEAVNVL